MGFYDTFMDIVESDAPRLTYAAAPGDGTLDQLSQSFIDDANRATIDEREVIGGAMPLDHLKSSRTPIPPSSAKCLGVWCTASLQRGSAGCVQSQGSRRREACLTSRHSRLVIGESAGSVESGDGMSVTPRSAPAAAASR